MVFYHIPGEDAKAQIVRGCVTVGRGGNCMGVPWGSPTVIKGWWGEGRLGVGVNDKVSTVGEPPPRDLQGEMTRTADLITGVVGSSMTYGVT